VTGSYANLVSLYNAGSAGSITGLGNENVTLSAAITVNQANTLASETTGTVTAGLSNTALADYAALTETGNDYDLTINDASVAAADLKALDAKTVGTITATSMTTLTGSYADVLAVLQSAGITKSGVADTISLEITDAITVAEAEVLNGIAAVDDITATLSTGNIAGVDALEDITASSGTAHAYSVTVTDTSVNVDALNTLAGKTSVNVDASAITELTGAAADVADFVTAYGVGSGISGLGNEALTVTGTVSAADADKLVE
jgi:hypothetical protein